MRMFQAHNLNRVNRVRFGPDTTTMAVVVRRQNGFEEFDLLSDELLRWDIYYSPTDLAYSVAGSVLAVADTSCLVRAFRRTTPVGADVDGKLRLDREPLTEIRCGGYFRYGRELPLALAFAVCNSPIRERLGIAGRELYLWNPHTQEYIVAPEEGDYRGISFGPDGSTVTSIEYHAHALCVWQVKPFQVLFRTDLKGIDTFDNGSVAMMPDGERVILAAGSVLRCVPINGGTGWDSATKKPPLEIALHPSGRTLLVADGSKKVTAYDTGNGKVAAQFDWGIGKIGCVTYSSDGTLAAAGGEKGQVVVWDAE